MRNHTHSLFLASILLGITHSLSASEISLRIPEPSLSNQTASPQQIIEEERWIASLWKKTPAPIQENKLGRLIIKVLDTFDPSIPDILPEPPAPELAPKIAAFPLDAIASNKSFLKSAKIRFDESKQIWRAQWKKPRMLHFGMLLKPALEKQVQAGESFAFDSQGTQVTLSKDLDDNLLVSAGDSSLELGAKQLKALLERKVRVDNMALFLDKAGNLILEAQGQAALALAQNQG